MNKKYKAVLFDLDGTLLNSLNDIGNALNRVLLEHNFPTHELNAYKYFIGDGARKLVERALPDNEKNMDETIQTCLEKFKRDYGKYWNVETNLYPNISKMLDQLSDLGIRLAILSNKPDEFTQKNVEKYLSKWTFDVVFGQQPSIPRKPDPAGALAIAEKMKIHTSDFLYLGDTAVDMITARKAGMHPVGALWGYRTFTELKANGAFICIKEPLELFTIQIP
jgi:phosphoglycolate phosphatase